MTNKSTKKRIVQIAIIMGVVILPLLYSYLYLGAFWDPYSTLNTLPVAVVNNDKGAVINDVKRNLGQELCDELKKDNSLKFVFTDQKTAEQGTKGSDYYATIMIPSNFSSDVATSTDVSKKTATLTFSPNEKRNFLAYQILDKAMVKIELSLRSKINEEITTQLSNKLKKVPDQLTKLQSGLSQLGDGSSSLKSGADLLSGGASTLANGTSEFAQKLSEYKSGTSQLSGGASDLASGTSKFSEKLNEYKSGVSSAKSGADSLSSGAGTLDSGLDALLTGATALETSTKDLATLKQGADQLAAGATQFNNSLIAYPDGVSALIKNVTDTSTFLTQYVQKNPSLMNDPYFSAFITQMSSSENQTNIQTLSAATTSLKQASQTISTGISQIASGTDNLTQLQAAISSIKTGLESAKSGSSKLLSGTKTLSSGLSTLNSGAGQLLSASNNISSGAESLNSGTKKAASGASQLLDASKDIKSGAESLNSGAQKAASGANQLKDGIATAKSKVDSSVNDASQQVKSLDGLPQYASEPVTVKTESINPVPNYGTAFAPYFMSLSLWVGAIIIFVGIYLDSDEKFKLLSRHSDSKLKRTFVYLLIGFTQAIVLAILVILCLGLHVNHLGLFLASCCLVSMVFLSIVQFLMVFLKDSGKFLSLVLLILQLTSCGGTFPMETVPKFFNLIYPFMPMTYSVKLFKETISGGDYGVFWQNAGILFAVFAVFTALTIILSVVKHTKRKAEAAALAA
ncbi:MAG: YhgE/Pip domain-containing protein [Bacillota bacterium]|nr:YhgE/Pip domain-containing protein [Bacillota bacterium]